jgi:hypothetical protein
MIVSQLPFLPELPTPAICQNYIHRTDPLEYLSNTLTGFHKEAYDGQLLILKFPDRYLGNYNLGANIPAGRCPIDSYLFQIVIQDLLYCSYGSSPETVNYKSLNQTCIVIEAVTTVEEKCHGKNECQIIVQPTSIVTELGDPCSEDK